MRAGRAKRPPPALHPSNSDPLPEKGLCCDHPSPGSQLPKKEESGPALHQLAELVLICKVAVTRILFLSPRQSLESV